MPAGERLRLRALLRSVPAAVRRDYVATLVVQWFVLGVGLLLFHLVARRGSVTGFAYYQIARGTVSTLQPILLLGLGVGLHRYLPRTEHTTRRLAQQALAVEAVLVTAVGLAGMATGDGIAALLGLPGGRPAVTAALIMLAGNCLCTVSLAALRGNQQIIDANLTMVLSFGLFPLFAFAVADRIEDFLIIQGVGTAVVGVWATWVVRRQPATAEKTTEPDVKTLIGYGVRRMPGEFALPVLYTFPTFAVAVLMPGEPEAGYVGFTTSAVTLICSVFAILTPVLMPRLSRLFNRPGDDPDIRRLLTALPLLAGALAAVPAGLILLFAPALVRGFLGPEFAGAVPVLRLGVLAAIPLAMFYAARPILDTLLDAKFMSRLLLACLVLEILATVIAESLLTVPQAAVAGLLAAGTALGLDAVGLAGYALRRRG
ncbi:lipopolysaccharide biosynthesis protein [Actinoplanes philippinensis]|uniref:lipopolysaccharide biosynthesis protein n=1 Tax=Actinoplanes philippinensis TaxID=35752 RepID=UPI0033DCF427